MSSYDDAVVGVPDLEVLASEQYDEFVARHADVDPDNDQPRRFQKITAATALEGSLSIAGGLAIALLMRTLLHWQGLMSTSLPAVSSHGCSASFC
jgi:hypothetical protein